jgi:hypothetical protein
LAIGFIAKVLPPLSRRKIARKTPTELSDEILCLPRPSMVKNFSLLSVISYFGGDDISTFRGERDTHWKIAELYTYYFLAGLKIPNPGGIIVRHRR